MTNLIHFVVVVTNELIGTTCVLRSPTNEQVFNAIWRRMETNYTQITQVAPNEPPDFHIRKQEVGEWRLVLVPWKPDTGRVITQPPPPGTPTRL